MIPKDKFTATWLSYSSMSDYLKCPRAYYLKNMYRDPKTNHKISYMTPALALGQVVHDTIDAVSDKPAGERLSRPLTEIYDEIWRKVTGKLGGFRDEMEEGTYKLRGRAMIERVMEHPGPLLRKAVKIRGDLPYFWLSEEDELILCGKIDWLEYLEETDSVRIIDFKTGKFDEDPGSLQLPIYNLLVSNTQKRSIAGVQYWYLDRDDEPVDTETPDMESAKSQILEIGKRIKLARKLERFVCNSKDGCMACRPLERIVSGAGTFVGVSGYNSDLYIIQ